MLGAVRAVHLAQHLRVARLQGKVEMSADAPARRCEHLDQIVVHIARLDARNTETHGVFSLFVQVNRLFEKRSQKVGEARRLPRLLVAPSVGAEVYPGEDDFFHAGTGKRSALTHHVARVHAGRLPACNVHDAVGAGIVAAVLDLHAHAGAVALSNGKRGPVRRSVKSPSAGIDRGCKLGFPHDVHARVHCKKGVLVNGGGTPGDDDGRTVVRAQRPSHGLARLLLGLARNRARVHHDEVGVGRIAALRPV